MRFHLLTWALVLALLLPVLLPAQTDPVWCQSTSSVSPATIQAARDYHPGRSGTRYVKVKVIIASQAAPGGDATTPSAVQRDLDGVNDCFAPIGLEEFANCYGIIIFDRWGMEVFSAASPGACWKGVNEEGVAVPDGVYYYLLTVNGREERGYVTLLR